MYLLIYVDDFLLTSNNNQLLQLLLSKLQSTFSLKQLGTVSMFLGIQLCRSSQGLFLHQAHYAKELLLASGFVSCKPAAMLMSQIHFQSTSDQPFSDPHQFCRLAGSQKKNSFSHEDELEQPEMIFTVNFGGQHSFTWSFNTWENSTHQNSTAGFEWKEESKSEKHRARVWSESDLEEDANVVDQHSSRVALGLPASGPLCLADVKTAFRESALKWHPDRHHGLAQKRAAIQDEAAEKFKVCVDAYNNLCNALKSS